jgi:hypothetical protein
LFDLADQHGLLYEGGGVIEQVRSYLLGIFAAAMISGIAKRLMGEKGTHAALVNLITGIFMVFTLIRPIVSVNLFDLRHLVDGFESDAAQAVQIGESQTRKMLAQFIKERTQSYILDKAQSLNAVLDVEVTLSDDEIPVPVKVCITGKVSPYARGRLENLIIEDLGIEKENQIWT